MSVIDLVNFGMALLGSVLGVITTSYLVRQNRVRLRVTPAHALYDSRGAPTWALTIEVVNLSSFPVTVAGVGLRLHDGRQMIEASPPTVQGRALPVRLESRDAVSVIYDQSALDQPGLRAVVCAFARTACGVERNGNSPALRQLVREGVFEDQASAS